MFEGEWLPSLLEEVSRRLRQTATETMKNSLSIQLILTLQRLCLCRVAPGDIKMVTQRAR